MDFAMIGGDARHAYLARLLCADGRDARRVNAAPCDVPNVVSAAPEDLPKARNVVLPWPCPDGDGMLARLSPGTRVWLCGPGAPEAFPDGLTVVDLRKDERLQLENAWLTAEGAICAAMNAGCAAMKDCHCLVIGWGRIGRALTELLIGMNARVTVASRSEKGRNGAVERGAECVSTYQIAAALPGKQIIFSTPPVRVLGERELAHADAGALILDLASPPYGVDLDAARALNLRAWREPKLTGRYCPYSAARALFEAIRRAEREGLK